jgi:hypothetical protein
MNEVMNENGFSAMKKPFLITKLIVFSNLKGIKEI